MRRAERPSVQLALVFRVLIGRVEKISEGEQCDADEAQGAGEGNLFFNLNIAVGKTNEAGRKNVFCADSPQAAGDRTRRRISIAMSYFVIIYLPVLIVVLFIFLKAWSRYIN